MVFAVELLPAGQGDAVVVEWGPQGRTSKLLIDAGPKPYWDGVRARLAARRDASYEKFVVTHVDEDHIGGALELLDDFSLRQRIGEVWFNGYVHCKTGGGVLGPVHGEQLTQRIAEGGYGWNTGFPRSPGPGAGGPVVAGDSGDLPVVELSHGARVVVLGPNPGKLKAMAKVWERVVTAAGLVPGAGADGEGTAVRAREKEAEPLPEVLDRAALAAMDARDAADRDSSAANGSSIALLFEYAGKRVLLPGDAHDQPVTANLLRYADSIHETPLRIDLVKLPHHGSGANLTPRLLAALASRRFLVSSDGMGYAHPDDSAIARAILSQASPVTFYCNYSSYRTAPWAARAGEVGATFVLPRAGKQGLRVTV